MRLVQRNLNHCSDAQDLLAQTSYESAMEIAIISETYRNTDGGVWVADTTGGAAICGFCREAIQYSMGQTASGFV